MPEAVLPVLHVVGWCLGRRVDELEQFQPDAVRRHQMRLQRPAEARAENMAGLGRCRGGRRQRARPHDQAEAEQLAIPGNRRLDIGYGHADMVERARRGQVGLQVGADEFVHDAIIGAVFADGMA